MDGPCCARRSNQDQLDSPELRIAAFDIRSPEVLSTPLINGLINSFLDQETFNWIVQIAGADSDGEILVRTGSGVRDPEAGRFWFADEMDLEPITLKAQLSKEVVSSAASNTFFVLPIFDELPSAGRIIEPAVQIPIRGLTLIGLPLTEARSCVGERGTGDNSGRYTTPGMLDGYITVSDAMDVLVGDPVNNMLCNILSCDLTCGDCETTPVEQWTHQPDSICDSEGCTQNQSDNMICDPLTECNAWKLTANIAAHAVDIIQRSPTELNSTYIVPGAGLEPAHRLPDRRF